MLHRVKHVWSVTLYIGYLHMHAGDVLLDNDGLSTISYSVITLLKLYDGGETRSTLELKLEVSSPFSRILKLWQFWMA